jgi:hypothetical protein
MTCESCRREMAVAPSCRPRLGAVRYGAESIRPDDPPDRCRDCGVLEGGVHHALCCVQQCGRCGGQYLTCEHGMADPVVAGYHRELVRQITESP